MQMQTVDLRVSTSTMPNTTNRLFCRLDGLSASLREQQRTLLIKNLGLLELESVPIFDEATQMAARFIEAPICTLSLMIQEQLWLKSAVGLSQLGLMNQLAASRHISRQEAFCTFAVDSHQPLIIPDTLAEVVFAQSFLTQHYGIRAYLGTPLLTAEGQCIGALAIMDLVPRTFTVRDLEFLTLAARWCLREFERNYLLKARPLAVEELPIARGMQGEQRSQDGPSKGNSSAIVINAIKLKLLRQLIQELRTPLTSVIGMSSVLRREVFGSLTQKQREYIDIVHHSGQHLNSLVEEILKLGDIEDDTTKIDLSPVNVEMICQQVINSLLVSAQQKHQQLRLSVEPGKRIWLLDKGKVRPMLYYLVMSLIDLAKGEGEVRIHVSRRSKTLNIAIWLSHPWLGDGLPQWAFPPAAIAQPVELVPPPSAPFPDPTDFNLSSQHILNAASLAATLRQASNLGTNWTESTAQSTLSLLLGCYLAECHGGKVVIQGSAESGYRYVIVLPKMAAAYEALAEG
jgi:hypothetical protein